VLILSAGAGVFVVGHYGPQLNPWELIVPVVLFGLGLGLGLGSSSLMLIAISGAHPADAGAASGLATQWALALGAVLFAAALLLCLLLSKPPARARSQPDYVRRGGERRDAERRCLGRLRLTRE